MSMFTWAPDWLFFLVLAPVTLAVITHWMVYAWLAAGIVANALDKTEFPPWWNRPWHPALKVK